MKWIGQHIWDLISRFRSDVYLEDLTTDSSTDILVVDSDGKVCKNSAAGDDMTFNVTGDSGTPEAVVDGNTLDIAGGTNISTVVSATDTVTANLDNPLAGPIEIEQGASGGAPALLIDNNDIDRHALKLEAANTTANALQIDVPDLTTGAAIGINADSLTTGSAIVIDADDALTTVSDNILLYVDYDKSGDVGSGILNQTRGIAVYMTDTATSNHGSSLTSMYGLDIAIDSANANGTVVQIGAAVSLTDGDPVFSIGYSSKVEDGGIDFRALSTADTGDYFTMATTTHGATKLITVDDNATAAHFEVEADGDIILDAAGTVQLEADTTIGVAGNTTATNFNAITNTGTNAGKALTVAAGSTTTGSNNINGGDLTLASGGGDGTGTSKMVFKTKISTTDTAAEQMRIHTNGCVGVNFTTPKTEFEYANDFDARLYTAQFGENEGGGEILKFGTAQEGGVGSLQFLHTDSTWNNTDADGVVTGASQLLGIPLSTDPGVHGMLLKGYWNVHGDYMQGTPAIGNPVYISESPGAFDFTAPSATGDFVRIVGYCIDIDYEEVEPIGYLLYFNPDSTSVEIA